jgi:hypothetical protein
VTWSDLFERAANRDVSETDVRETLQERREDRTGGRDE